MAFYEFCQNNSGGFFDINDKVAAKVYIEANSAEEANEIAKKSGDIYFDGVEDGIDCECCGDRWLLACGRDNVAETREELLSFLDKLPVYYNPFKIEFSARVWYKNGITEAINLNK